jgi:hypothetical protein
MEKAKIPTPVRLEDADEARKAMYGGIAGVRDEFDKDKAPLPEPEETTQEKAPPIMGEAQNPETEAAVDVSDEDKRAFVRSILGGRAFTKTYVLFGAVTAVFTDRTPDKTLKMYEQVKTEADYATHEWPAAFTAHCLASTLTALEIDRKAEIMNVDDLKPKIERLKQLPRPLYLALLDTAENFEHLVDLLVDKAQDRDFWLAGGST